MSDQKHLLGNNPINNHDEDLFNFKHYSDKVKRIIQLNSSNNEPLTIGIYGKWGEGKTSFLNLIKYNIEHFEKDEKGKEYLVFEFNPWRYSDENEMLFDFFDGISKRFFVEQKTKIQKVGNQIIRYSRYLKAIKISTTIGIPKSLGTSVSFEPSKIFEALGEDFSGEQITLENLKDKVNDAINDANFKVIVFIDDLDRLDKNEIYTILKLIKLTANFDNFIFITTLDSEHVAKAIKERYGDNLEDGKLFLEKIINIPIHLPKIEEEDLQYFFETKFNQIIKYLDFKEIEKKQNEIKEIIQGFSISNFNSPREIIRVLNGFFIGAFGFEDEINFRDLFWIEYIKVKDENLYNKIKNYNSFGPKAIFNGQHTIINFNDDEYLSIENFTGIDTNENVKGTRKLLSEKNSSFKEIIDLIFPNIIPKEVDVQTFEENLNINSVLHFNKYFSFHTERKIKNSTILKIKDSIKNNDSSKLRDNLNELFNNERANYKELYTLERVINSSDIVDNQIFLYNFIFDNIEIIPEYSTDIFDEDYRLRIVKFISNKLKNDNYNNVTIIQLAHKIETLEHLLGFLITFNKDKPFVKDLEILFLEKFKKNITNEIIFFKDYKKTITTWIIEFWNKYDKIGLNEYIENNLSDIENIKCLIRNFSDSYNGGLFGAITKRKFQYMKNIIDVDFVFNKITQLNKSSIKAIDINEFQFEDYEESTIDDNFNQFIYWYLYEKNQNDKIDKILN